MSHNPEHGTFNMFLHIRVPLLGDGYSAPIVRNLMMDLALQHVSRITDEVAGRGGVDYVGCERATIYDAVAAAHHHATMAWYVPGRLGVDWRDRKPATVLHMLKKARLP